MSSCAVAPNPRRCLRSKFPIRRTPRARAAAARPLTRPPACPCARLPAHAPARLLALPLARPCATRPPSAPLAAAGAADCATDELAASAEAAAASLAQAEAVDEGKGDGNVDSDGVGVVIGLMMLLREAVTAQVASPSSSGKRITALSRFARVAREIPILQSSFSFARSTSPLPPRAFERGPELPSIEAGNDRKRPVVARTYENRSKEARVAVRVCL